MHLSPYANYEIRRMLKEHVDSVSVIQARSLRVSESVNITQLLQKLYPRKFELVARVRNLEMLMELYQQISTNRSLQQSAQTELKQRIFRILGIRFGVNEVVMPSIAEESAVSLCPFFAAGAVREGMLYQDKFFGRVDQAQVGSCPELYRLAMILGEQGLPCLITTTAEFYSLWVGLRSPVYGVYLKGGIGSMRRALALHSVLCGFKQAKFREY
jgi:hypothetical protein